MPGCLPLQGPLRYRRPPTCMAGRVERPTETVGNRSDIPERDDVEKNPSDPVRSGVARFAGPCTGRRHRREPGTERRSLPRLRPARPHVLPQMRGGRKASSPVSALRRYRSQVVPGLHERDQRRGPRKARMPWLRGCRIEFGNGQDLLALPGGAKPPMYHLPGQGKPLVSHKSAGRFLPALSEPGTRTVRNLRRQPLRFRRNSGA
jgi:hypothetical protein